MSSTSESRAEASSSTSEIPEIKKGASLLIAYQLANRPVLLIGGGVVAAGRLFFLLESGAHITLIAPGPLESSIAERLKTNGDDITWYDRPYLGREDPVKVTDFVMVLTAIDDNDLSRTVCHMARENHIPVNVADVPPECDFYFGAQFRKGPLQVMVSTQGQGPRIGAMVRNILQDALPDNVEEAIQGVGALRKDLRDRAPGVGGKLGKKRMDWMIQICDSWGLEEMASFNDERVRREVLDRGWEKGEVVAPGDVGRSSRQKSRKVSDKNIAAMSGLATGLMVGVLGMMAWTKYRPR